MFDYIVRLKKGLRSESLIEHHLPHLFDLELVINPEQAAAIASAYGFFSDEQKAAFESMRRVPYGMFFVNGHGGTGKAHWAVHVAAMSQTQTAATPVKVMYLLETSKAVDELSSKLLGVYDKLRVFKNIIRIPSLPFRFEKATAGPNHQLTPMLNFTMGFLRQLLLNEEGLPHQYPVSSDGKIWVPELTPPSHHGVPNLDEVAYAWFLKNRA